MKYNHWKIITSSLAISIASAFPVHAEMDLMPSDGSSKHDKAEKHGKGKKGKDPVMKLINLSDEQLDQMEAAIKKIRNMSSQEKEELKKKMGEMKNMDPEKRKEMKEKMKKFQEIRQNMSKEEKQAFKKEMSSLSKEERHKKIQELIQKNQ